MWAKEGVASAVDGNATVFLLFKGWVKINLWDALYWAHYIRFLWVQTPHIKRGGLKKKNIRVEKNEIRETETTSCSYYTDKTH